MATQFGIPTGLKVFIFYIIVTLRIFRFYGVRGTALCTAHKLNSHRSSYLKITEDICRGNRGPYVVCFRLGNYPAPGFYMPTFRNNRCVPSS